MKTDDLIALLVASHAPVDTAELRRKVWLSALAALIVTVVTVPMLFGVRTDLDTAAFTGSVIGKAALGCSVAVISLLAYDRTLRPGVPLGGLRYWLAVPFLIAVSAAVIHLADSPISKLSALIVPNSVACLLSVLILSLAPLAILTAVARRGAPVNAASSGLAAGLASAGLAVAGYSLFCTEDSALFVGVLYSLAMVVPAALGALAFPHLVNW